MSFFERNNVEFHYQGTTKGFYLGSPEAEAENSGNRKLNLVSFFQDYLNISEHIHQGKFIITGRKGSGKSAYAQYLLDSSVSDDHLFCKLLKPDALNLESVIQETDFSNIGYSAFFEWVILIEMVKNLIESKLSNSAIKKLEQFQKKNSGVIGITDYKILPTDKDVKYQVRFNVLKGILDAGKTCGLNYQLEKAPFYQLIPTLREIVIKILKEKIAKKNDYVVMFDDLDLNFTINNDKSKLSLLDLIRITRQYNTEYFKGTTAKVLIFLRDDIGRQLNNISPDKNKIFGSYEFQIKWYQHDIPEESSLLRKFINKRIFVNFQNLGIACKETDDMWSMLVKNEACDEYKKKTAFKFILDFTFYRPRDLIYLFNNIGDSNYKLPLQPYDIKSLLKQYIEDCEKEIRDELSSSFSSNDIEHLFEIFKEMSIGYINSGIWSSIKNGTQTYQDVVDLMKKNDLQVENVLPILVEYNLLIPIDAKGHQYFTYREQTLHISYSECTYTLPKCLYYLYRKSDI